VGLDLKKSVRIRTRKGNWEKKPEMKACVDAVQCKGTLRLAHMDPDHGSQRRRKLGAIATLPVWDTVEFEMIK
jgi:hypothetical protein